MLDVDFEDYYLACKPHEAAWKPHRNWIRGKNHVYTIISEPNRTGRKVL